MKSIEVKRIYEIHSDSDGYRILVDRLWPRGLKKEKAEIDEWNKNIAPSTELRKWFGHKPENFEQFTALYKTELSTKAEDLKRINAIAKSQNITLLYAAKDECINHAIILQEVLHGQ